MPLYQKVNYTGNLSDYQKFPKRFNSQVIYERDRFNPYQNFLYKRALFGLSIYSKEELDVMHYSKKKRINNVHMRAQGILNVWKQQLMHEFVSKFLSSIFHHSKFVKDYTEKFADVIDDTYISKTEFRDLGVSKENIIEKLIQEKILPHNFYELK
jgi:hypothetical protein